MAAVDVDEVEALGGLIEMNRKRQTTVSTPERVWEFLQDMGYVWHQVDGATKKLVTVSRPRVFRLENLFAVPSEKIAALE